MSKNPIYSNTEILSISDTYLTFITYFIAFMHYFFKISSKTTPPQYKLTQISTTGNLS